MSMTDLPVALQNLLFHFAVMSRADDQLPDESTPLGQLTREVLRNIWINCRDGFLRRTSIVQVWPEPGPWPRVFQFVIDAPYKRKLGADSPVELMPGPIRGAIYYRPDLFVHRDAPQLAVQIDPSLGYLHPNHSREHGFVCLGDLPPAPYPFPLDLLLETHIYPILSYQNRRPAHALDREAAAYFALDPRAMEGLEPARPLY